MTLKRDNLIRFRVTDEELERLKKIIEKSNLSQQEFCRRAAFKEKIVVIEGFNEFRNEVSRIGNNLNQLTKAVHQNEIKGLYASFDTVKKELKNVWLSLNVFLDKVQQK